MCSRSWTSISSSGTPGMLFAAEEAGAPRLEAPGPPSTSVASPSASASLSLYYSRGEHPTSATWSACLVTVMGGTSLGMGEHPHESPGRHLCTQSLNDPDACWVTILGEPRLGWGNILMRPRSSPEIEI